MPKKNLKRFYVKKYTGKKLNKTQRKQVQKIVEKNLESKSIDFDSDTTMSATPFIQNLAFDIPQGDGEHERIGAEVTLYGSINFNFKLICGDAFNTCRIIFFQWNDLSTALPIPSPNLILEASHSGSIDPESLYNIFYRKSYTILWDKKFSLIGEPSAGFPTAKSVIAQNVKISLKKARKKIVYEEGLGFQFANGRIFILYVSDSLAFSHPKLQYCTRLFYKDG